MKQSPRQQSKKQKANGNLRPESDIQMTWETDAGCVRGAQQACGGRAHYTKAGKQESKDQVEKTDREGP